MRQMTKQEIFNQVIYCSAALSLENPIPGISPSDVQTQPDGNNDGNTDAPPSPRSSHSQIYRHFT